jgi:hypothetical protein
VQYDSEDLKRDMRKDVEAACRQGPHSCPLAEGKKPPEVLRRGHGGVHVPRGQPVPVVSIQLHSKILPPVLATIVASAERSGVVLADHQWPALESWSVGGHAGIGIDPAAMFMAGEARPIAAAQRVATRIISARLSDVTSAGRVAAGKGRLDLLEYEVALSTASYARPVIVDLRGVAVPPLTPDAFDPA